MSFNSLLMNKEVINSKEINNGMIHGAHVTEIKCSVMYFSTTDCFILSVQHTLKHHALLQANDPILN